MKIALIGPTYPYRGGIAHYNTLLCRALRVNHEVKFISFKRQYPRLLFPGKSDQDNSGQPLRVDDVEYIIDSLNPVSWRAASQAILAFSPDKLVIPWWVAFWALPFWYIASRVGRRLPSEIVFICHNVEEHESGLLKKKAARLVLSLAHRLITHSKEDTEKLQALLGPSCNPVTAFLPTYTDIGGSPHPKKEAKMSLGVQGKVLLFFGFVRDYKGLDILLSAMPLVLERGTVTLLIAGEFWKDKQRYLKQIERSGISPHVKIIDRYLPDEEIGLYFGAADLVVQPYTAASGSAICQLAYGFDRPVIATRVGSLPEVIQDHINGRIVDPRDIAGLADAILDSLECKTLQNLTRNAAATKERYSWQRMADIVAGRPSSG